MFSFSLEIQIPNLDKHPIEVPCPNCELHTWVTLGEIKRGDFAICRGCHANILLIDHLGKVKQFEQKLVRILENFGA
jgi:hypothetical protein